MKIIGIIPARYASTRFPGKPLVEIKGKAMIQRVYEQALKCSAFSKVVVATDDDRIFQFVKTFGGQVMMTSEQHQTGTDRCAEIVNTLEALGEIYDVAINIQGDEPFIQPNQLESVASLFDNPAVEIGTLVKALHNANELLSPTIIKVVFSVHQKAIYFSRTPIPYLRNVVNNENWFKHFNYFKHIGIYAYRTRILKELTKLKPGLLESAESLEQLRWLENGYSIYVKETHSESHSVDVPEDLEKFNSIEWQ